MDKPEQVARDLAVAERHPEGRTLVLEGDPKRQLEFAQEAAKALMGVIKPRKIGGRDYLEFSGWQTVGRFYGGTVNIDWSRPMERAGKIVGYEARAVVLKADGSQFSSAEAQCTRDERSWRSRDEFALRSMAQTRAGAKALRNAFGWVVELAGYASTPAEEMDEETGELPPKQIVEEAGMAPEIFTRGQITALLGKVAESTKKEFWHRAGIDKVEDLPDDRVELGVKWLRSQLP